MDWIIQLLSPQGRLASGSAYSAHLKVVESFTVIPDPTFIFR